MFLKKKYVLLIIALVYFVAGIAFCYSLVSDGLKKFESYKAASAQNEIALSIRSDLLFAATYSRLFVASVNDSAKKEFLIRIEKTIKDAENAKLMTAWPEHREKFGSLQAKLMDYRDVFLDEAKRIREIITAEKDGAIILDETMKKLDPKGSEASVQAEVILSALKNEVGGLAADLEKTLTDARRDIVIFLTAGAIGGFAILLL